MKNENMRNGSDRKLEKAIRGAYLFEELREDRTDSGMPEDPESAVRVWEQYLRRAESAVRVWEQYLRRAESAGSVKKACMHIVEIAAAVIVCLGIAGGVSYATNADVREYVTHLLTSFGEVDYPMEIPAAGVLYTASGRNIWVVSSSHAAMYDHGGLESPLSEFPVAAPERIASCGDSLYLYRDRTITEVDEHGAVTGEYVVPGGVYIRQFLVSGDTVYAAAAEHPETGAWYGLGEPCRLCRFSLRDPGSLEWYGITVNAIAEMDETRLLLLTEDAVYGGMEAAIWDTEAGSVTREYPLNGSLYSAIVYANGTCCLLSDTGLHCLDLQNGSISLAAEMPQDSRWLGLAHCGSSVITEDFAAGTLKVLTPDTRIASESIRIVNAQMYNDPRLEAAIRMFRNAHPDIGVELLDVEDARLATALMANEPGFDILLVRDEQLDIYRSGGIAEDLSDCAAIWDTVAENWNAMPGILDGRKDAVPFYVLPKAFLVQEGIGKEVSREFGSWQEFYDLGAELVAGGQPPIGEAKRWPEFFGQYLALCDRNGNTVFDTECFRSGMECAKNAYQTGLTADPYRESCSMMADYIGIYPETGKTACMPCVNGEKIYPCECRSLIVSRMSERKEEAKELLAYYVSTEAQSAADVQTMWAGFLKDASLYACYDGTGRPDPEQEQLWAELLCHAVRTPYNMDFNIYAGDRIELFMDGGISLDELVRDLDRKYQMTLLG